MILSPASFLVYPSIICHIMVGGVCPTACTGVGIIVNTDAIDSHSYCWVKVVFEHISTPIYTDILNVSEKNILNFNKITV